MTPKYSTSKPYPNIDYSSVTLEEYMTLVPVENRGNCVAACIASILEMETNDVFQIQKHFVLGNFNDAHMKLDIWLLEKGYKKTIRFIPPKDQYCIAIGKANANKNIGHCVVWLNDKMVHDPSLKAEGIGEPTAYWHLTKIK